MLPQQRGALHSYDADPRLLAAFDARLDMSSEDTVSEMPVVET